MTKNILLKLFIIVGSPMILTTQVYASFNNDDWNAVLREYVNEQGYVDYHGLNENREQFARYIQAIKTTGPKTNPQLFPNRSHKLAYYINAYNALVFEGVLNRGPEEKSVWRGLISGLNFFVRMKIIIDGEKTNLKKLEDDIIRKQFKDPRIHAALNCASISCPRLPQQAFEAETLDQQLDSVMREFVNQQHNVKVDHQAKLIYLSKIFDWFKEDFIEYEKTQGNNKPGLVNYINRYRDPQNQLPLDYEIKFFKYNKGINKQVLTVRD